MPRLEKHRVFPPKRMLPIAGLGFEASNLLLAPVQHQRLRNSKSKADPGVELHCLHLVHYLYQGSLLLNLVGVLTNNGIQPAPTALSATLTF